MLTRLIRAVALLALLGAAADAFANIPGGGTGIGPAVTIVDNVTNVTIANGIVSILCTKAGATIDQINYTWNNGSGNQTVNLLSGGNNGGQLYWELGGFGGGTFAYSLTANPAANGGNYAEISLVSSSASSGTMEVRFSMLRGSTGFYVTPIWSHRSTDGAQSLGETRDNIYAGSIFNWMSVDATRNRLMEVSGGSAIGVLGAPQEVSLWTNGIYAGQYEDKYKYTADFGDLRVWGWGSVGAGGKNVGLWNVSASVEYYNGGPMKRELFEHIGTTILNVTHGSHFGGGTDSSWAANEAWTHVYGPYFIYCNFIPNSITATNTAAQALYADALAQAAAEQTAWPYVWFTNVADYAQASSRGLVTGQILINDAFNPNASESNLWVGVVQQPLTSTSAYDFQDWVKPYQFWARTDANGRFVISNVIAGANYTLYAFGPGAAGTFQSQAQSGGSAPNSLDIPASPFSVTVASGITNDLGTVTWTPTRVGPTVFEIGYPDRTARKFRHGEDWWVGDVGPNPASPSPVWSKFLEYPFDFPSGPNYTVGQSRWATDWNFVQPIVTDSAGNYNGSTSTITFNLASAPGATASLYIALSSDFQGPLIVQVNGNNLAGSSGYFPSYSSSSDQSDATIREGIHGMFSDARFTFSGSLLQVGQNTITLNMRKGGYFANHAMYDYIRLEMQGYVPPAPASVVAFPGNNRNLVCWPLAPGATSYNLLRSTTSGSGYVSITNGVVGPVCGSGWNNATFVDTTAVNGGTYYYVVQAVNPVGASANSAQSSGTTPSGSLSASPPATPTGLSASAGHQTVALNWSASAGASFYTLYRSTLFNNGGGASNILGMIVLANNLTGTSYADTSPTDGTIYSYAVAATSAAGTSANSASAVAVPLPATPAGAPAGLAGNFIQTTNILLTWSPVPGAVGYIVRRATSPGGPFVFQMSVTETNYLDGGLDVSATWYYQVAAMNAAGVSTNASVTVIAPPLAPTSLSAIPGNTQIVLNWSSVPNATAYWLFRGTSSNNEDTVVVANYPGTSYTNTGLINGQTYYYVVAGTNSVGLGSDSPEASATPSATNLFVSRNLTWRGDGSPNLWDVSGADNWVTNNVLTVFNNGDSVLFDNTGSNNVAVTLAGNLQPALVTYNAPKSYNFSGAGSIVGTNQLVKTGSGTLTINTTNTYSGGTVLSNGTVVCGNIGANATGLGIGPVTFDGGTLEFNGWTGSNSTDYGGNTNGLVVPTNQTGTIHVPQRFLSPGLAGSLSGSGTLNLQVKFVRGDIPGNWSAFTGRIIVTYGSGGATIDDFRVANAAGFPAAKLNLGTNVSMYSRATGNSTIPIGEFSAAPGSLVSADGAGGLGGHNAVTWSAGGLNTDATNAASFSGIVALTKVGSGTWTLTGASTHTGSTTVSNGTMLVNGSFNGAPVAVNGGLLGGIGVIAGAPVTINPGGGFAPGNPLGLGTLTISNDLTLAPGSTTFMKVQHNPLTNNQVKVFGTLAENGTLNVSNSAVAAFVAGDHFKLFDAAAYTGGFTGFALPALNSGLRWDTSRLNGDGSLWVVSTSSPLIAQTAAIGTNFVLTGTGGTPNWSYSLLSTTDLTAPMIQWTRVATNFFDSSGNFTCTNRLNPAAPQSFFRIMVQ
jgi:rhamnogalacturonan endolyase